MGSASSSHQSGRLKKILAGLRADGEEVKQLGLLPIWLTFYLHMMLLSIMELFHALLLGCLQLNTWTWLNSSKENISGAPNCLFEGWCTESNEDLLILDLAMKVRVMGNLFRVFAGEENLIWLFRKLNRMYKAVMF